MAIIESHNIDHTPEFIKLYNQGKTRKQIKQKLNITEHAYKQYKKQNKDKLHKYRFTRKCPVCENTFKTSHSHQKYCSNECAELGQRKRISEYYRRKRRESEDD